MNAKFDFYEIARVVSSRRLEKFNGLECTVVGRAQDDDTGEWSYAIDVGNNPSCAFEYELEKTGKFASREKYKPVDTVRVRVLPDGSGEIVDDNNATRL